MFLLIQKQFETRFSSGDPPVMLKILPIMLYALFTNFACYTEIMLTDTEQF